MSEELLEKTKYEFINYLTDSYMLNIAVDVIDNYKECLGEYKELQQRIETAIDYINREDIYIDIRDEKLNFISTDELLKILKGDNNE